MNTQRSSATTTGCVIDTTISPAKESPDPSVTPAPPSNKKSDVTSVQGAVVDKT